MRTYTEEELNHGLKRFMTLVIVIVFGVSAADFYSSLAILFPMGSNTPVVEPVLGLIAGVGYGLIVIRLPPIASLGWFGRVILCVAVAFFAHNLPMWANWFELRFYSFPELVREYAYTHDGVWRSIFQSGKSLNYCIQTAGQSEVEHIGRMLSELGWTEVWRSPGTAYFIEGIIEGIPEGDYNGDWLLVANETHLSVTAHESGSQWACPPAETRVGIGLSVEPSYWPDVLFYSSLVGGALFCAYGVARLKRDNE